MTIEKIRLVGKTKLGFDKEMLLSGGIKRRGGK